jgi:hypothetical protein
MRLEIHNINDWMEKAADALDEGDAETLDSLLRVSEDWLQDERSLRAQRKLIEVMLEACFDLEQGVRRPA